MAVLAGSSLTGNLKAQSAWPSKQVRITVPSLVANLSYHPQGFHAGHLAGRRADRADADSNGAGQHAGSIHPLCPGEFRQGELRHRGIELLHVPYKGGTPLTAALLAGDIQAAFIGIPNAVQPLKSGRLKTVGISTLSRSNVMPDIPTMAESGIPGFDLASTMGMVAAAGTAEDILA